METLTSVGIRRGCITPPGMAAGPNSASLSMETLTSVGIREAAAPLRAWLAGRRRRWRWRCSYRPVRTCLRLTETDKKKFQTDERTKKMDLKRTKAIDVIDTLETYDGRNEYNGNRLNSVRLVPTSKTCRLATLMDC